MDGQMFPSRRSPILIGLIIGIGLYIVYVTSIEEWWIGALFLAFFSGITWVLCSIRYSISNGQLFIYSGIGKPFPIPIESIREVSHTYNPLSSPAASLLRLEVKFGTYNSVLISPKDRVGFVKALLAVNSSIKVKLRAGEGTF